MFVYFFNYVCVDAYALQIFLWYALVSLHFTFYIIFTFYIGNANARGVAPHVVFPILSLKGLYFLLQMNDLKYIQY